jgi:hypothetical protein
MLPLLGVWLLFFLARQRLAGRAAFTFVRFKIKKGKYFSLM